MLSNVEAECILIMRRGLFESYRGQYSCHRESKVDDAKEPAPVTR